MDKPKGDPKPYLDYLDKEMTIEGILSAFCVAVVGFVLDRVLGAEPKDTLLNQIRQHGFSFVLAGSAAIGLAALCFYLQRSYLAITLGKIASATIQETTEEEWNELPLADEIQWGMYQCGFGALTIGALEYALALASSRYTAQDQWWWAPWVIGTACTGLWFWLGATHDGSPTFADSFSKWLDRSGVKPAPETDTPGSSPQRKSRRPRNQ